METPTPWIRIDPRSCFRMKWARRGQCKSSTPCLIYQQDFHLGSLLWTGDPGSFRKSNSESPLVRSGDTQCDSVWMGHLVSRRSQCYNPSKNRRWMAVIGLAVDDRSVVVISPISAARSGSFSWISLISLHFFAVLIGTLFSNTSILFFIEGLSECIIWRKLFLLF